MERPIFKPAGTPVEELDTPTLTVDVQVLERNLETLHSFFRDRPAKVRPRVASHRCPAIAHKQMAAEGTVGGVCVNTVGQAEAFAAAGFSDVFVANEVVTSQKVRRLCALARHAKMTVAVDSPGNVQDLSEAAVAAGVSLNAAVEIHTRTNGCGVEPGQPAVDLAKQVVGAAGLGFTGLVSREGPILTEDQDELAAESRKWIQQVLDTRQMVEQAGIDVGMVSVGGTSSYSIAGAMEGVTEVPAGAYALMDARHAQHRKDLRPAARVMTTVTSVPEPGVVITDSGQKAIGIDLGLPVIEDFPGAVFRSLSAEHGNINTEDASDGQLSPGDKLRLIPWDIGVCANIYDYIHVVRDGRLEMVWDVTARGRYR